MEPTPESGPVSGLRAAAMGRPFSFGRLFGGTWLAYTNYGILLAVLPLAELSEGGGPILATLVLGAPLLAQTLSSWAWGWLADRTGTRRAPLVLATALQAPLFLTFPLLSAVDLFVLRIVQSALFGSLVLATTQATEERSDAAAFRLGRLQLAQNGGMLLGVGAAFPLLLGAGFQLRSIAGWELSVLLAVFMGFAALVFAFAGDIPRTRATTAWAEFTPRSHPGVFWLAGATTAVSTFRYVAVAAIPVYLAGTLGRDGFFGVPANTTAQLAVWVACSSALNIVASPFSGRWAERLPTRHRSLLVFSLVYAAIWAAIAASPTYPVVFSVWILPVAVFFTVATVREAAYQSRGAERGRAVGLLTAAFNLGGLLGGAIAGALLASAVTIPEVFAVATVGSLGSAFLFIPSFYRTAGPAEEARASGAG